MVHYASSAGESESMKALCESAISDASDFTGISAVRQGPWASPTTWNNQVLINTFKARLGAAASRKPGWLFPIQKVMAEDCGIHLAEGTIYKWVRRLTLAKNKPGALLAPSSDPKTPRSRFIHMLPAVANNIKRHFSAMDARLQRAVDSSSLEEVTNRSPVKEAVKAENAALKHELADWRARSSEARAQVSLLEGEIATIH